MKLTGSQLDTTESAPTMNLRMTAICDMLYTMIEYLARDGPDW